MEYFILKPDGEQTGTFSMEQIRAMLNSGIIGPDTRYWHEGITDWQPIDRIEESVNFPEPDPHQPHTPPPHEWSGSVARAIPSPRQQQRLSESAAVSPGPAAPESPAAAIPTAPSANGAHAPAAVSFSREQAVAEAPRLAPRRSIRIPLPSAAQVRNTALLLLAVAIIAAIVASRHPAKSAFSQVTLTPEHAFGLITQTEIRSYETEMHKSPVVAHLKDLIANSTDPAFIQSATVALQQEIARHETNVTHDYVQNGRAEILDPGSYHTVAFFDATGGVVVASAKAPWAAIDYKGAVVYVYLGSEFEPCPK